MNRKAFRLAGLCASLELRIEELRESAGRLELFWDGEANAAFILAMEEDFFKICVLQTYVKQAAGLLIMAVMDYQKTELIIQQKIGGIKI